MQLDDYLRKPPTCYEKASQQLTRLWKNPLTKAGAAVATAWLAPLQVSCAVFAGYFFSSCLKKRDPKTNKITRMISAVSKQYASHIDYIVTVRGEKQIVFLKIGDHEAGVGVVVKAKLAQLANEGKIAIGFDQLLRSRTWERHTLRHWNYIDQRHFGLREIDDHIAEESIRLIDQVFNGKIPAERLLDLILVIFQEKRTLWDSLKNDNRICDQGKKILELIEKEASVLINQDLPLSTKSFQDRALLKSLYNQNNVDAMQRTFLRILCLSFLNVSKDSRDPKIQELYSVILMSSWDQDLLPIHAISTLISQIDPHLCLRKTAEKISDGLEQGMPLAVIF